MFLENQSIGKKTSDIGRFVGWIGWIVGLLVCGLVDCLVGRRVGRLIGGLVRTSVRWCLVGLLFETSEEKCIKTLEIHARN